jgi:hypothetical protein
MDFVKEKPGVEGEYTFMLYNVVRENDDISPFLIQFTTESASLKHPSTAQDLSSVWTREVKQ